jgi:hypothetical protein
MLNIDRQCGVQPASFHFNPTDEIYLSDDEPDLLNEVVKFETDFSDDEDQVSLDVENTESSTEFLLSFDILNSIKPETCMKDSEDLLKKLCTCLEQFSESKGKPHLTMLNELGFKIMEKLDKHCEPSIERRKLMRSLDNFCDQVDDILSRLNETQNDPSNVRNLERKVLDGNGSSIGRGPLSPKTKVIPPGTWQKLRQPKESEAKQMHLNAKGRVKNIKNKMEKICIAPGEYGEFQNWGDDIFIEEKCFPHLFPHGIGGYLSTALEGKDHDMGFANYVRHRVMSADPKYRQDYIYLFFLLLVKELIALKRCKETYLRQATKVPKMTKQDVLNVKHENLVRYNRTFEVFKTMRGTSSYYQQSKKNLMAMLRQKGCPTLFVTISCAEYKWK